MCERQRKELQWWYGWVEHTIRCANHDAEYVNGSRESKDTKDTAEVELDSCWTGVDVHVCINEATPHLHRMSGGIHHKISCIFLDVTVHCV